MSVYLVCIYLDVAHCPSSLFRQFTPIYCFFLKPPLKIFQWTLLILKLVSPIFCQIFMFHQIIALQKLWKIIFISSKKLFSFLRYINFCIFFFPSFFPVSHCFRGSSNKNLKIYDVINCQNKNLITHFVCILRKK